MRVVTIHTTGSMAETFTRARLTCNPNISRALTQSLSNARKIARATAPVYDPAKWLHTRYRNFPHHRSPHGVLKASIGMWRFGSHAGGKLFTGTLFSMAPYSNWVENGVWVHNVTHRPTRPMHYMKRGMEFGFEATLDRNMYVALVNTFGGKP